MKNILVILLLFPFYSIGQDAANPFKIDQGKLIWQKVYNSDVSIDQVLSIVSSKGLLQDVVKTENGFTGRIQDLVLDYKGLGMSEMSTPMYIARSSLNGGVIVESRDGRYRVTVTNMIFVQRYTDTLTEQGEKTPIETYSGTKAIKKGFLKEPARVIDYSLDNVFKPTQVNFDDNW